MPNWGRLLRYRLAYLIAPDWIDDLEYRFSCFLCDQTGGRMSKCYYTLEAMRSEAEDARMRECDECEFYKSYLNSTENTENPKIDADPVHAAGGCYCWECKNGEEWENRNGIKGYKCSLLCADISPEAFCSYGKRREAE